MNDEQATVAAGVTDRIADLVIGLAAGDTLGAGHEYAAPPRAGQVAMLGDGLVFHRQCAAVGTASTCPGNDHAIAHAPVPAR